METKYDKGVLPTAEESHALKSGRLRGYIPRAQIQKLTVMLTETCNLDCWMCDFARSKKLTKSLSASPNELVKILQHPVFNHLKTLTFTGGEPFSHPNVGDYFLSIKRAFDRIHINFSSNSTLLAKMLGVFETVDDWQKVGLLVSIDGITRHDQQRRTAGTFLKTTTNLDRLRERFSNLTITLKFTITPLNHDEIYDCYRWASDKGYVLTVKMLEFNEFYTNKLRIESEREKFAFTANQIESITTQLKAVLADAPCGSDPRRVAEIREVLASLAPEWHRPGKCFTPTNGGFIDCDLNLFMCKEYPPIINLQSAGLDDLAAAPGFHEVYHHERENSGRCTRCTSQMKMQAGAVNWRAYLKSLLG